MKNAAQEELQVDVLEAVETTEVMDLVVFNDDFNTFAHGSFTTPANVPSKLAHSSI